MPTDEAGLYSKLIGFLAFQYLRVPFSLSTVAKEFGQLYKGLLIESIDTPEKWQALRMKVEAEGKSLDGTSRERMLEFWQHPDTRIVFNNNFNMKMLLDMVKAAIPYLLNRKWWVIEAPPRGPEFITSDRPLVLTWMVPIPPMFDPALGLTGTRAFFPVSPRLGLFGAFERALPNEVGTREQVATCNLLVAGESQRWIYSASRDFGWMMPELRIGNRAEFLSHPMNTPQ